MFQVFPTMHCAENPTDGSRPTGCYPRNFNQLKYLREKDIFLLLFDGASTTQILGAFLMSIKIYNTHPHLVISLL